AQHAHLMPCCVRPRCDHDSTTTDAKVERLQHVRFCFEQHIAPNNATVHNSMLDVNRHVRRFDEHEAITPALVFKRESARRQCVIAHAHACTRQHAQSFILHPPLRHCDGQRQCCVLCAVC